MKNNYNYIGIILLLCSLQANAAHSLLRANTEVDNAIHAIINKDCSISRRLYNSTDADDIIFIVTVTCGNTTEFTQYLVNVYEENNIVKFISPIIVGDSVDYSVESISIDNNIVLLNGYHWAETNNVCCPPYLEIKKYILNNHQIKEQK